MPASVPAFGGIASRIQFDSRLLPGGNPRFLSPFRVPPLFETGDSGIYAGLIFLFDRAGSLGTPTGMREWIESLEQFVIDVILERRTGKRAAAARFGLRGLSHVYGSFPTDISRPGVTARGAPRKSKRNPTCPRGVRGGLIAPGRDRGVGGAAQTLRTCGDQEVRREPPAPWG